MLFTVTFNKGNKKCAMLKPCRVYSASYRRADNNLFVNGMGFHVHLLYLHYNSNVNQHKAHAYLNLINCVLSVSF